MKLFLFIFITTFFVLESKGQNSYEYNINGFPIDSINAQYITAEACNLTLSTKVFLELDYGQETKFLNNRLKRVADKRGDYVEFKSNMDALNFLSSLGFQLIDTNYIRVKDDDIRAIFLLKKMVRD